MRTIAALFFYFNISQVPMLGAFSQFMIVFAVLAAYEDYLCIKKLRA